MNYEYRVRANMGATLLVAHHSGQGETQALLVAHHSGQG